MLTRKMPGERPLTTEQVEESNSGAVFFGTDSSSYPY
jgi:hypothetical protein